MERLMSDGYPFIFQMIDKSESDKYLIQTLQYRFKSDTSSYADELANIVQQYL